MEVKNNCYALISGILGINMTLVCFPASLCPVVMFMFIPSALICINLGIKGKEQIKKSEGKEQGGNYATIGIIGGLFTTFYSLGMSITYFILYTSGMSPTSIAQAISGVFILGLFLMPFCILGILYLIVLLWVVKDAKARGIDCNIVWILRIMFFVPFSYLLYIFTRPQGKLFICPNCENQRLQGSVKCPHCGVS